MYDLTEAFFPLFYTKFTPSKLDEPFQSEIRTFPIIRFFYISVEEHFHSEHSTGKSPDIGKFLGVPGHGKIIYYKPFFLECHTLYF